MSIVDLFPNNDTFIPYQKAVDETDGSMAKATNCLAEIYERVYRRKFRLVIVPTKGSSNNIKQCDFETYNLIFEGER